MAMDHQESSEGFKQIMQYPLTEDECYSPEAFEAAMPKIDPDIEDKIIITGTAGEIPLEYHKKGKDSKSWGKNILNDPTNSGIGEELMAIYWDRPNPKDKKAVKAWKEKVNELIDKYNELVGFEAWGKDYPEPYDKD